jgi:hypothetical protein
MALPKECHINRKSTDRAALDWGPDETVLTDNIIQMHNSVRNIGESA